MKVLRKQANSKSCIICGMDNPLGVKAPFYEMEDNSVVTLFSYRSVTTPSSRCFLTAANTRATPAERTAA